MSGSQPIKIGKYYGLEVVGRGNTSTVYRGYDPFNDREVAIKLASQAVGEGRDHLAHKIFFNEVQSAGALVHPNIVRLLDAGDEAGAPYLVMEYVDGGRTLLSHCRPDTLLPADQAAEIVYHCARALDYSHRHGIIHRDVKPTNVLLQAPQRAKLADFGIAHCISSDTTQIAGVVGSPRYMSPEQIMQRDLSPATDIYSLGVVMHELLSGVTPFHGDNLASLLYSIVNDEPAAPARALDVSGAMDVVRMAMAKNPDERFSTGRELADALLDVFSLQPSEDHQPVMAHKHELVRGLDFFHDFSDAELEEVLEHTVWREFARADTVVVEGNLDLAFYIIAQGSVDVRKSGTELCTLPPGACFGEMGFMSNGFRSATVVAREPVTLLVLDNAAIRSTTQACQLKFNEAFIRTLIARLGQTSEALAAERRDNAA